MSIDNPADHLQADDDISPAAEDLAAHEAALRRQLDELAALGLRPCNFLEESAAPRVDEQMLLRLSISVLRLMESRAARITRWLFAMASVLRSRASLAILSIAVRSDLSELTKM